MSHILTITLNPAVDLATSVDQVVAGPKLYCKPPVTDPGGGGVNVARAIRKLGGQVTALVALGGVSGERLQRLLVEEGVPVHPVPVSGETRESIAVTDESTGAQFRFSFPGQTLNTEDGDRLLNEIAVNTPRDGFVVLSGGAAPGLEEVYADRILAATAPRAGKLIVDTSQRALEHLVARPSAPLHVLRLDRREAEQAAGHTLETVDDNVAFAASLIARGVAMNIVIGRQAEGSLLVTADASFMCRTPQVPVVSKIGAGDAFLGAFTLALSRGDPPQTALQWGVAAATATMGTEGTGLFDSVIAEALVPQCEVDQV